MLGKVKCGKCGYQAKKDILGGLKGVFCPNCDEERLGYISSDGKYFKCYNCNMKWSVIPCPKCGTGISSNLSIF